MNLTLSLDAEVVARAREAARASGKSLNQLIREYIRQVAGMDDDVHQTLERLRELRRLGAGNSHGKKIRREDAYDRTILP